MRTMTVPLVNKPKLRNELGQDWPVKITNCGGVHVYIPAVELLEEETDVYAVRSCPVGRGQHAVACSESQ